jgi:AcrR family transcriptional regulator
MSVGQSRGERAARTRQALIAAARELFVTNGYFATGTEDIVALANVGTGGALYHHFADKQDLFRAVFDQVQSDLAAATVVNDQDDALDLLTAALQQFLDASADDPAVQQVLLVDGPAVLGWEQWRNLEAHYGLGAITAMLDAAVAQHVIEHQRTEPLALMLLAAVDEAALYIANASDRRRARNEARRALQRLLDGLRTGRTPSHGSREQVTQREAVGAEVGEIDAAATIEE